MRNKPFWPFTGALLLVVGAILQGVAAEDEAAPRSSVWVVDLDGAVGPASADLVIRAIEDASEANAEALVIRMDTPGGLMEPMRDIISAILNSDVPVATYVSPGGARADSAGTYLLMASHIAAMETTHNTRATVKATS